MKKLFIAALAVFGLTIGANATQLIAYCTLHPLDSKCHPKPVPGPKGEKGDKGDKGDRGKTGKTGKTGAQGEPGKDGKDGLNGKNGENGKNGANGKNGQTIVGPQGPEGKPGAKGDKGDKGEDGKDYFGGTDANRAAAGSIAVDSIDFGTTHAGVLEVGAGVGYAEASSTADGEVAGGLGLKYGITDTTAGIVKGWVADESSYAVGAGVTYRF